MATIADFDAGMQVAASRGELRLAAPARFEQVTSLAKEVRDWMCAAAASSPRDRDRLWGRISYLPVGQDRLDFQTFSPGVRLRA
jgi:hypothetical protein